MHPAPRFFSLIYSESLGTGTKPRVVSIRDDQPDPPPPSDRHSTSSSTSSSSVHLSDSLMSIRAPYSNTVKVLRNRRQPPSVRSLTTF